MIGCWFQLAAVEAWQHGVFILGGEILGDFDRVNVKVVATKKYLSAKQVLTRLLGVRKLSTI